MSKHIQSDRAVFRGDLTTGQISAAILRAKGFEPRVMILSLDELEAAIVANPFPEAEDDPKSLHLLFLAEPSPTEPAEFDAVKGAEERFMLTDAVFYLHTPKYLSGSKLAVRLESLLKVAATGRNWRSIVAIRNLTHTF